MQHKSWVPPTVFRLITAAVLYIHPVAQIEAIPPVTTAPPSAARIARLTQISIDSDASRIAIGMRGSE